VLRQLAQAAAGQQAAAAHAHSDQADAPVGEIEYLQRTGVMDKALDVLGHELLGTDEHVHREAIDAEESRAARVLGRADARDLGGSTEQREGHFAGHQVHLVAGSERDDDLGLGSARRLEHRRMGGVAGNGAHVEPVLHVAQAVLVAVHHRHLVRFFA